MDNERNIVDKDELIAALFYLAPEAIVQAARRRPSLPIYL